MPKNIGFIKDKKRTGRVGPPGRADKDLASRRLLPRLAFAAVRGSLLLGLVATVAGTGARTHGAVRLSAAVLGYIAVAGMASACHFTHLVYGAINLSNT